MLKKSILKAVVTTSLLMMGSLNVNAALVSHTLDFDNIQPPRELNPNFSAVGMNGSGYAGFNWGNGWFAVSEGILDTYLATSSASLFINRAKNGEGFQFEGFEYWSRGGDGDGRKFFYVLYGADGQVVYNSDLAGDDLKLRVAHNAVNSTVDDLIYGLAIGFINGGDNDGWRYMGIDDFKFSVDSSASVNTSIPGFNVASVPVPATFTLFLSGLGLLGFLNRRTQ